MRFLCHEGNFLFSTVSPHIQCPRCYGEFIEEFGIMSDISLPPFRFRNIAVIGDTEDASVRSPSAITTRNAGAASIASIDSIPAIKITDPNLVCAVCTDQFDLDVEAKELPCKHIYHPDCILPWLSLCNTCPMCRFELPLEHVRVRRTRLRSDMMLGSDNPLRLDDRSRAWRRNLRMRSQGSVNSSMSSTQTAQLRFTDQTESVEMISSRPGNEDADTVISNEDFVVSAS